MWYFILAASYVIGIGLMVNGRGMLGESWINKDFERPLMVVLAPVYLAVLAGFYFFSLWLLSMHDDIDKKDVYIDYFVKKHYTSDEVFAQMRQAGSQHK